MPGRSFTALCPKRQEPPRTKLKRPIPEIRDGPPCWPSESDSSLARPERNCRSLETDLTVSGYNNPRSTSSLAASDAAVYDNRRSEVKWRADSPA